jgi:hypothetical protein
MRWQYHETRPKVKSQSHLHRLKRIKPTQGLTQFGKSNERGEETKRKIRPGKIRCLSLKQAVEISGSPFHLRVRLFLDGCCMDLDESRAQFLGNKSSDRTVILLSISDGFQQHLGSTFSLVIAFNVVLTSEDNVCFRGHTKIL